MKGVLIINLGTPDSPNVSDVRKYLREFLSDPFVIKLPRLARWILLNFIILPFRPKKSAEAYQAVWQPEGSPLMVHSRDLQAKLAKTLGDTYKVELGMRYGNPSIKSAVQVLKHCSEIMVIPLFPQFAQASTGTAIVKALKEISKLNFIPNIKLISDFYDKDFFLQPVAEIIENCIQDFVYDHILFSYHGLPEQHLVNQCYSKVCRKPCPKITEVNRGCYRAQCYYTSHAVAKKLNLESSAYSVAFQSRLGRTPWIVPYTDEILSELREKGISRLAIACPSFVADCLETIEEIGMRAREDWLKLGGTDFKLIPCINSTDSWVNGLASLVKNG